MHKEAFKGIVSTIYIAAVINRKALVVYIESFYVYIEKLSILSFRQNITLI